MDKCVEINRRKASDIITFKGYLNYLLIILSPCSESYENLDALRTSMLWPRKGLILWKIQTEFRLKVQNICRAVNKIC